MREEIIGDCRLILGDCRDVLPELWGFDLLLTDPPYGIGAYKGGTMGGGVLAKQSTYEKVEWDNEPIDESLCKVIIEKATESIIFGGNYFHLPPAKCWLVWDKDNGANNFADAELAWTNIDGAVRLKKHKWQGMLQENMSKKEERHHPTQKPVPVMEWCIGQAKKNPQTILDPFMGSGTTGVACANMGRKFTGIEREPKYFDIACKRIDDAYRQTRMFA